jgi:hypothetical protein
LRTYTQGMVDRSRETDDLGFLLRDVLYRDVDIAPDTGRVWSGVLARVEARTTGHLVNKTSNYFMPCEWILGWRMVSLAQTVS